jgi:hypothetical protein
LGGRDQEGHGLKPAPENSSQDLISKLPNILPSLPNPPAYGNSESLLPEKGTSQGTFKKTNRLRAQIKQPYPIPENITVALNCTKTNSF